MSERRVRAGGRSASGDREVLEGPLRARLDELVRSADELDAIDFVELGCRLGAEEPSGASRTVDKGALSRGFLAGRR